VEVLDHGSKILVAGALAGDSGDVECAPCLIRPPYRRKALRGGKPLLHRNIEPCAQHSFDRRNGVDKYLIYRPAALSRRHRPKA
jgi:hypothetical protein